MKKGFKGFIKVQHKDTGVIFTLEIDSYDKKMFDEVIEEAPVVEMFEEEDDIPMLMTLQNPTEEPAPKPTRKKRVTKKK